MSSGDMSSEAERWQAVVRHDPRAAGAFVYGVVTTGVYCRPGCASRRPRRENVRFFEDAAAAERAGFRPCKRCAPQEPVGADAATRSITLACQLIAAAEQPPTLPQLATAVGLSTSHLQRLFKKVTGITPKQYAAAKRLEHLRAQLQPERTITTAVYQAGFASGSRFYETATATLGMRPTAYRAGGKDMVIRFAVAPCYLGWVLVAATAQGMCRIDLDDAAEELRARLERTFPQAELVADDPAFGETVVGVVALLEQPRRGLALPLDIQGTAFQRQVWLALQGIPAGSTASYAEIAARIGRPQAARAVAQACAANKLAVAIPCHRVVRHNGDLSGYRWGVERKRALLAREAETPA